MSDELVLKFDPNTIEHLGISLYSKLPSVISELVSNSWDADANNIEIDFIDVDGKKSIHYVDDGLGMTFDELNLKYLKIGRNRRSDDGIDITPSGRKVIGKKGLGKLSVFGICDEVSINTVKNGIENEFRMNINDIKNSSSSEYKPQLIIINRKSDKKDGTSILLDRVRRKSGFLVDELALGLSKKFVIFDEINLNLKENGTLKKQVTNELKFNGFNRQFEWNFPNKRFIDLEYDHASDIKGHIYTLETPVKDTEMRGVYLTSRGKIVNIASFYGLRDNDQFHSYVTGYLSVDFIDEIKSTDLISTDRHSLNWEHDETKLLQTYLQTIIKKISKEWKEKRRAIKREMINEQSDINLKEWRDGLPSHEGPIADSILNPVLGNTDINVEDSVTIVKGVMDKFDNASYKEYAYEISQVASEKDFPRFLELIHDWKLVESKQISDLARSRIAVIKKFEDLLRDDTREVPTLHNFLKTFSWLLDPRILEFRDEVTYGKLLKESFPEQDLVEKDRRIDFLCSNALGGILYIIEIKRSKYKIDRKAIEQAYDYGVFIREKYATGSGFSNVVCYVVGGEKSSDPGFKSREATYMRSGEVYVKTYRELLEQSKNYHQEFIDAVN